MDKSDKDTGQGLERVLKELGVLGRYQIIQLICHLGCLSTKAFLQLNFAFIGYEPGYNCHPLTNETLLLDQYSLSNDSSAKISYDSCSITVTSNVTGLVENIATFGCINGYNYDGGKYVSMVTEWDLVCDNKHYAEYVQSMMAVGQAIGLLVWPSIADRFGRKYVYMFITFAVMSTELGLSLSQSVQIAIVCRFLSGLFDGGRSVIHLAMGEELFISKHRQIYGGCDCLWYSLNSMGLCCAAYLLRNSPWKYLQLVTVCLFIPTFALSFCLVETPVWYFSKSRYEDAKRVLTKAFAQNKKDIRKMEELFRKSVVHEERKRDISEKINYSLWDLIRHPRLLVMSLVASFAWLTCMFSYYGLFFTASKLAGDRYLNAFLMSATELPGYLIYVGMLVVMGRRTVLTIYFAIAAGALSASAGFIATYDGEDYSGAAASTAFFLLGRFAMTVCFNIIYSYTPEMFPTSMRSSACGLCVSIGSIGGVFAPFLVSLYNIEPWYPSALNALLCCLCVILVQLLPETRGRPLPNTIEEVYAWKNTKNNAASPTTELQCEHCV